MILTSGIHDMTLGTRTLRAETAALYCLSMVHYELVEAAMPGERD